MFNNFYNTHLARLQHSICETFIWKFQTMNHAFSKISVQLFLYPLNTLLSPTTPSVSLTQGTKCDKSGPYTPLNQYVVIGSC